LENGLEVGRYDHFFYSIGLVADETGLAEVLEILKNMPVFSYGLALLLMLLGQFLNSVRWYVLLRAQDVHISIVKLLNFHQWCVRIQFSSLYHWWGYTSFSGNCPHHKRSPVGVGICCS
jgi:hypothetical protein